MIQVLGVSSKTLEGFTPFWQEVLNFKHANAANLHSRRSRQRVIWTWTHVQEGLERFIADDLNLKTKTDELIKQVEKGTLSPGSASDKIISYFTSHMKQEKGRHK